MLSDGSETAAGNRGARARRPRRRVLRLTLIALALILLVMVGGFFHFLRLMRPPETIADADGIVVLTGAAFRINDALELLAAGHGKRLLITGVNPITRPREISRLVPAHQRWFDCCVDLDHSATNTITNAVETRRWVRQQSFGSLIVVTSNFHMPRAMAELDHQLPDVRLVPFPVMSDKVRVESWWSDPQTARFLLWEYLKYMVAQVRMRLESALD